MKDRIRQLARRAAAPAVALALLAAPQAARAKIDLVTLPGRDSTQVTIYKSEDLTLVRETRTLTFGEGRNEIQFSWANTMIDPTSLQIRLVKNSSDFTVLDASYPANTQNTLIWNIEARKEGQAEVEITYFASGLSWSAEYSAIADPDETELTLEPKFTITNASGEDYVNAQTRLVVGEINLVEAIRMLAERGIIAGEQVEKMRRMAGRAMMKGEFQAEMAFGAMVADGAMPAAPAAAREEAKEIIKKAVSEYYLYTIEGTEDLEDGWGKQLPNPTVKGIPFDLSYEWNPNKYGRRVVKFYKFKNDAEHELGDVPMPEGAWYVSGGDGRDSLRFQGVASHKYVPVGEDVELQLGSDGLVLYEEREMGFRRYDFERNRDGNIIGHRTEAVMEIEIRNSHRRPAPFKITRPMGTEDWEIRKCSDDFKKVDRATVEWEVEVPALSKKVIAFTLQTNLGSRSTTNK